MQISEIHDCHVHFGKSSTIYKNMTDIEHLERAKEKYGIGSMAVMPFDTDVDLMNAKLAQISRHVHWVKALYWITTANQGDFKHARQFAGAKFHGSYENKPVSWPDYEPILQALNDAEKPLLVHCGRYKEAALESNTSYKHALIVAQKYPKIKVIFAHMGGSDTTIIRRCIQDVKDVRNAYLETSGITTPYIIEYAQRYFPHDRLMFGSDIPWCSFNSKLWNILDADVSETFKEKVFSENFERVFA